MDRLITGKTKLYAVIGDPISHSISPEIHNRIFKELDIDGNYISLRIPSNELRESMGLLRNNFKGFNVTIPHKEAIIPLLDELDERAKIYGAVNTVKIEDGKLKGYNTDGYGFVKSLEDLKIPLEDKSVMVLGAGGAARVIAYELLVKGCDVTIANRNLEKAKNLKGNLMEATGKESKVVSLGNIAGAYQIIVNTTPVGMSATADQMPITEDIIKKAEIVYDLIYNPNPTKLLKVAKQYNCRVINGLTMLFYQAVKAEEIWLGNSISDLLASKVLTVMTKNK
ncbi:shikimate dehydrogenase [Alkaliphilus hydrothermalis]|uniref:Shikimate dehydrogenase (NADP(+)) n=1 Tax=Alkaliphilus hydrothermalis TaxID=1482730 RepID=A0ABS2NLD4_9FIRM|nr:shikimate dehydrogenase [Alkaliphilus hydrothermalis]MBM7613735.1 shikimate dehydrogenase [Alkaliphilus hydrothermalis]